MTSETPTSSFSKKTFWIGAGLGAIGLSIFFCRKWTEHLSEIHKQFLNSSTQKTNVTAADNSSISPGIISLSVDEFRSFKLREIISVNHNTSIFRFDLPTDRHILGMPIASCLLTKFVPQRTSEQSTDSKPIIRPYTPITDDTVKGHFDLMVKKYEHGPMSTNIHSLLPGDVLEFKGPIRKIQYTPNMRGNIGMIAGGTGITPMLQILRHISQNPQDKTKVSLLFANVTPKDVLLKEELDSIAKNNPNISINYTVDMVPVGASSTDAGSSWKGDIGRISESMIEKYMPEPSDDSLIMVCGPDGMLAHVCGSKGPNFTQGEIGGLLKKKGFNSNHVYKF